MITEVFPKRVVPLENGPLSSNFNFLRTRNWKTQEKECGEILENEILMHCLGDLKLRRRF